MRILRGKSSSWSGGGVWTPASDSEGRFWYDASDTSTYTLTGAPQDNVSAWSDKYSAAPDLVGLFGSGQAWGTQINSLDTISFPNNSMENGTTYTTDLGTGGDLLVTMVGQIRAGGIGSGAAALWALRFFGGNIILNDGTLGGVFNGDMTAAWFTNTLASPPIGNGPWIFQYEMDSTANTAKLYVDNVETITVNDYTGTRPQYCNILLGVATNLTNFIDYDLGEFVCSSDISTRANCYTYFSDKWKSW